MCDHITKYVRRVTQDSGSLVHTHRKMRMTFKEKYIPLARSGVSRHELTMLLSSVGKWNTGTPLVAMILNLLSPPRAACSVRFICKTEPSRDSQALGIRSCRPRDLNSLADLTIITHLTICLCLSTQYLIALLTSISCFFVNPFGPTPPLKVMPAVGRKVAVKSCRLLYMLRRSRSSMLSPCGGTGGGALSD